MKKINSVYDDVTRSGFDILIEAGYSEDAAEGALNRIAERIAELDTNGKLSLCVMNISKARDIFGERGARAAMHLWNAGCLF